MIDVLKSSIKITFNFTPNVGSAYHGGVTDKIYQGMGWAYSTYYVQHSCSIYVWSDNSDKSNTTFVTFYDYFKDALSDEKRSLSTQTTTRDQRVKSLTLTTSSNYCYIGFESHNNDICVFDPENSMMEKYKTSSIDAKPSIGNKVGSGSYPNPHGISLWESVYKVENLTDGMTINIITCQ